MSLTNLVLAAAAAAQTVAPAATQPAAAPTVTVQPVTVQPAAPSAIIAPAPKAAVILSAPAETVLRSGTPIALLMSEGITTNGKKLRVGQRVKMQVASDVRLGNAVVIPVGSPAEAEITDVRNKGMWGKSGRIEARVLSVRVGDRLIRLSGTFDDKGTTGTAAVVGSVLLLPVAGFFMTGTSANIPAGSGVKAFLDEDLRIAVAQ